MRQVSRGLALGAASLLGVLVLLATLPGLGLGVRGLVVGVGTGLAVLALAARAAGGAAGSPSATEPGPGPEAGSEPGSAWGPASHVTALRSGLVAGVAALVLGGVTGEGARAWLVALAVLALVLDGVDGAVARRTGTATAFGARFDMEVDALLILLLSLAVAGDLGWWVLSIGAARYLLLAATLRWPWLGDPSPARWWAKTVAVVQGVTLVVAASGVLPRWWAIGAVSVALALLAESFWWQVRWLRRHRGPVPVAESPPATRLYDAAAVFVVWAALALPETARQLSPAGFLRMPAELLVLAATALVVPARLRRAWAVTGGALLALIVLVKALNLGFTAVLDRPFDPLNDRYYVGPGIDVLRVSVGSTRAVVALAVAAVATVAVCALAAWGVGRLERLVRRRPRPVTIGLAVLAVVWAGAAVADLELTPKVNLASVSTSGLVLTQAGQLRAGLADREDFDRAIADDPLAATPDQALWRGLRGKDVLVVFVESYGRVALEDPRLAPAVRSVLDDGTRRLRAAGYHQRSAYLTSPTFGAASWLAHATVQSGLWVDSQRRYNQLLLRERMTLTDAFGRAGWRTVLDLPAVTSPWPQGAAFYKFDHLYDATNVGYAGPAFGYAPVPDQYTLEAFRRLELAPTDRAPVMAEIDLVSSHHPWTPLPSLLPWEEVGDGSVFGPMAERGPSAAEAFGDPEEVRRLYRDSVVYSWTTLISFLERYPDPDLVVLALGDHQPHSYVSGPAADHDVPATLIAQDTEVIRRVEGWGWASGLRPPPDGVVWRMDEVRDRLLDAFG